MNVCKGQATFENVESKFNFTKRPCFSSSWPKHILWNVEKGWKKKKKEVDLDKSDGESRPNLQYSVARLLGDVAGQKNSYS